ncbi:MAG: hypothetical protein QE487_15195 [Fluviicola sp.]|nr:hypothetical protein [Fluviicola sp.]
MKRLPLLILVFFCFSCSESSTKKIKAAQTEKSNKNNEFSSNIDKESVAELLTKFPELSKYKVFTGFKDFAIEGDFYGTKTNDLAIMLSRNDTVKICVIRAGKKNRFHFLGTGNDELPMGIDYSWAGKFETVKGGEILWSNYEDDFRSLDQVPESEKVVLDYDAIYVHALESCGGGFIFWKNGKFNWLQQE